MKKIRIFIAILVTILICCCFISAKPKSFLNSANAETTSTTSNVTFYGEDRTTPLLNIPNWENGATIYNFNSNNLIQDSLLLGQIYSTGGPVHTWLCSYGYTRVEDGLFISTSPVQQQYLVYRLPTAYLRGKTIVFGFSINGVEYYSTSVCPETGTNLSFGSKFLSDIGFNLRCFIYPNGTTGVTLDLRPTSNYPIVVNYAFCYFDEKQDFYSYDYLKRLYFIHAQIPFNNLNDYDLLFTNNYYQYTQYFNASYIVQNDTNFYITYKEKNLTYLPTQDFTITNGTNTFSNTGQNLLNSINQNAISFEVLNLNTLNFDSINYTSSYTLNKLIADYELNISNYSTYIDNYGNEFYFRTFVTQQDTNYLYQNELYDYNIKNSTNFVYPLFDFSKNLIKVGNTYKIFGDAQVINFTKYSSFSIEYKINYNMQFYYADYFGIGFDIGGVLFETQNDTITLSLTDRQNRNYFYASNLEKPKQIVLNSPYLKNSLIDTFRLDFNTSNLLTFPFDENNFASTDEAQIYFNNMSINVGFDAQKLYFYNPETNTNASAIIPTTSDGLYKEKEHWYDFTTDLYNFVIYICFDAPFISNITQLLYVIISLIKKLFDLIIALFTTSNSTIFIAIFFGFFLLKMILNKVIGGKE